MKGTASRKAHTRTTTFDDGRFERTAIVCEGGSTVSLDLVDSSGVRLAQVNVSYQPDSEGFEVVIVDVIDVDKIYSHRRMHAFGPKGRKDEDVPEGGNLVSADFRRKLAP